MQPTVQTSILKKFKLLIAGKWNRDTPVASIFRNMTMLASGIGASKIVAAMTLPVITRIYLPEHMGVLAVFSALTALIVPFGSLRYTMALPLPKNDGIALNLAVFCGVCLLFTFILVFLVLWWGAQALFEMLSMEKLVPFWWLVPVAAAGTGLYELLTSWAVREKAFRPMAKSKVWQAILGGITKIGLGLLGFKPSGLLLGQVFNQAGGVFSLFRAFRPTFQRFFWQVSWGRMLFVIRHYADFPKYRLPSQFLLIFSTQAPLLYFAWHFGAEITGQLGLALAILALPMTLFGQTTGQAYYAEIARIGRKEPGRIYNVSKGITKQLFLVSILPFFGLVFFSPWLFQVFFGAIWREAGVFASILALYLVAQFISSPLVNVFNIFEKQWMFLIINILRVFGVIFVFGLSFKLGFTSTETLLFYSIGLSIFYILTAFLVFKFISHVRVSSLI